MTAARLAAHGIHTARDLLLRLPRGYDDLRAVTPLPALATVADGTVVLVRGTVRRVHVFPRRLLDVFIEDAGVSSAVEGGGPVSPLRARWFRAPAAMAKGFAKGSTVALAGAVRTATGGVRELLHPTVVTAVLDARGGGGLGFRPRYGVLEGVRGRILERLYASALACVDAATPELVPATARARLGLPSLHEALARAHAPADADAAVVNGELARARRRIALETVLVAQVAFLLRRAGAEPAAIRVDAAVAARARAALDGALPFSLTTSQAAAVAEIARDLAGPRPMQRLLVGDVGSGKTAVALAAAAMVGAAGGATLMMLPTEVLAEQQLRVLSPLAAPLGLRLGLLTGGMGAQARGELLRSAAAGGVDLLLGTQALLGPAVDLPRLGLVIVDEQHRFGVGDRSALRGAGTGPGTPHLLTMSATPIPRSLALALHGDLDASFLTERPSGRRAASAVLCAGADERKAAYARLRDAVADGRQAFVVCPVRQEARRPGAVTAIGLHARLVRELAPARVGLLHGALPAAAKERALRAFAAGESDVLVATTVVELGIDVANATVMIIEDADRFGLAQLHQLRGRVGRGAIPGLCFLCAADGDVSETGRARLALVSRIDDGFALAEADLAQRGFGELLGTRQAGAPQLALEDLTQLLALTETAHQEAAALLGEDPGLGRPEHEPLARAARARMATMFAGDAG